MYRSPQSNRRCCHFTQFCANRLTELFSPQFSILLPQISFSHFMICHAIMPNETLPNPRLGKCNSSELQIPSAKAKTRRAHENETPDPTHWFQWQIRMCPVLNNCAHFLVFQCPQCDTLLTSMSKWKTMWWGKLNPREVFADIIPQRWTWTILVLKSFCVSHQKATTTTTTTTITTDPPCRGTCRNGGWCDGQSCRYPPNFRGKLCEGVCFCCVN